MKTNNEDRGTISQGWNSGIRPRIWKLARREEETGAQGGGGRQRRGRGSQTVGRGFLASLKRLMEALEATEAHFIRCGRMRA